MHKGGMGHEGKRTDVRVEEALVGVVGVEVGVGVAMVGAVAARPPLDRALDGAGAKDGKEVLERGRSVVRAVGPEPVVTCERRGRQ